MNKADDERAKFEILKPPPPPLARERIFIKTYGIKSRFVVGPENILFAGVCVHLSARKLYRPEQ